MAEPLRRGDPHRRTRPGGRSAAVNQAIVEATIAELVEHGYAELSFDRVAARAGVHRTTLYRRWANKEELAAEALLAQTARNVPMPDTGSTRSDLRALLASIAANISAPGSEQIVRALLSEAGRSSALATVAQRFWDERFALVGRVLERAITRGDLPADLDTEAFIEALAGPLFFRLLVTGRTIDAATAAASADRMLDAAQRGAFTLRTASAELVPDRN